MTSVVLACRALRCRWQHPGVKGNQALVHRVHAQTEYLKRHGTEQRGASSSQNTTGEISSLPPSRITVLPKRRPTRWPSASTKCRVAWGITPNAQADRRAAQCRSRLSPLWPPPFQSDCPTDRPPATQSRMCPYLRPPLTMRPKQSNRARHGSA